MSEKSDFCSHGYTYKALTSKNQPCLDFNSIYLSMHLGLCMVQMGDHTDLILKNGFYAKLVRTQADGLD